MKLHTTTYLLKNITLAILFTLTHSTFAPAFSPLLSKPPVKSKKSEHPVVVTYKQSEGGQFMFFAKNKDIIPYTIVLKFPKLHGFESDKDLPYKAVIQPDQEEPTLLLTLKPLKAKRRPGFSYSYQYRLGDLLKAKHDDTYLYIIPYAHASKHQMTQGYNGGFTHIGSLGYAVDLTMPIGTEIYSARGGIIIGVKEDSNIGGIDASYEKHGNYIRIYHEDGTTASYAHLKQNGAIVEKGDKVVAGQLIGYSGNTGRTSGPHLHFDVRITDSNLESTTIPVSFRGLDGKPITLEPMTYYYSTHPELEEFPTTFGRDIINEDYDNYSKPVEENRKVKIRHEKIDNTYVLFIENGYDSETEVTLTLKLDRMYASKEHPLTVTVPALTESYLLFIRRSNSVEPKNYIKPFRFQYGYQYKFPAPQPQ